MRDDGVALLTEALKGRPTWDGRPGRALALRLWRLHVVEQRGAVLRAAATDRGAR